jgi:hypothetical protein
MQTETEVLLKEPDVGSDLGLNYILFFLMMVANKKALNEPFIHIKKPIAYSQMVLIQYWISPLKKYSSPIFFFSSEKCSAEELMTA